MALFKLPKKAAIAVVIFVVLFFLAFALKVRAADLTVNGGYTTIRGPTPTVGMRVVFPEVVAQQADIEMGIQLIGNSSYKGEDQPSQAMLITQLVHGISKVDLGLGAALLQNEDVYNSGKFCFALSIRYRFNDTIALEALHVSNAGTSSPNIGRDMAVLAYRFK